MSEPLEDLHASDTVPISVQDVQEMKRKSPNVTQLLADGLDWLQYDMSQHDQSAVAFFTRILINQSEGKTQIKYVRYILLAIAVLLLVNAVGLAVVIHLLGLLIGHVR